MTLRYQVNRRIAKMGSPITAAILGLSTLATPGYANDLVYVSNIGSASDLVSPALGEAVFTASAYYSGLGVADTVKWEEQPVVAIVGDDSESVWAKALELSISDGIIEAAVAGIVMTGETDLADSWNVDSSSWVELWLEGKTDQLDLEWQDQSSGLITAETETILNPAFNFIVAERLNKVELGKGIDASISAWLKGAEETDSNVLADWQFAETETILAPALANDVIMASFASSASPTLWQRN
jgi:hypothetical protein